MSWWGPLRLGKNRAAVAALEEQVTTLQAALAKGKPVARRSGIRGAITATRAALILALGFALGVHNEALKQSIADLGLPLGAARPVQGTGAESLRAIPIGR